MVEVAILCNYDAIVTENNTVYYENRGANMVLATFMGQVGATPRGAGR